MKLRFYKLAGIFISILFVYLAVRKVDVSAAVRVLGDARFGWLFAAALVYLGAYPLRALRWRRILRDQKALSLRQVLVPVFVGYMANNVLPARAGEIYRAHFLGRRADISRSGAAGSIVVERTLDGLMLIAMVLLVFLLFPQTRFLAGAALIVGLAFATLAASILLYGMAMDRSHRIIDAGLGVLPKAVVRAIEGRLEAFLRGIQGISTPGGYLGSGALTVLIWATEAAAIGLVMAAFGVVLPLSGYVLVYALATLGTTIPAGPGYVGPLQYAFVVALDVFAISDETALAVSVATQLALLGSVTVIGLALLWREQLRAGLPGQVGPTEEDAD